MLHVTAGYHSFSPTSFTLCLSEVWDPPALLFFSPAYNLYYDDDEYHEEQENRAGTSLSSGAPGRKHWQEVNN